MLFPIDNLGNLLLSLYRPPGECSCGRPRGELTVTRFDDVTRIDSASLRIDRADPCILVTDQLLREIRRVQRYWPMWQAGHGVTLACPGTPERQNLQPGVRCPAGSVTGEAAQPHAGCPEGDVLRVLAGERSVLYRIGQPVPHMHCYEAEWPD